MASTVLLDRTTWDLVLDANGDVAMASEPYALAQDAASAIRTWLGEVYFDTTIGVPYLQSILGHQPSPILLKALFVKAALTVPGVTSAKCFLTDLSERRVSGQVQVTSDSGETSVASFTAATQSLNP